MLVLLATLPPDGDLSNCLFVSLRMQSRVSSACNKHLFYPFFIVESCVIEAPPSSGVMVCSSNGTGSSSVSSLALVAIPDCVDNATQTDISFQNLMTLGEGRGHHHHHRRHGSPPRPPPSPPLPHLVGPYGINEL